eukprot:3440010-Amphidinium_carterae.1
MTLHKWGKPLRWKLSESIVAMIWISVQPHGAICTRNVTLHSKIIPNVHFVLNPGQSPVAMIFIYFARGGRSVHLLRALKVCLASVSWHYLVGSLL